MSSDAPAASRPTNAADGVVPLPVSYRWLRPIALAVIAIVLTAAFNTDPRPGVHGRHLAITVTLLGIAVGTGFLLRFRRNTPRVLMPVLLMVAVSSAVLVGLQPGGPGFFGVFPAVTTAAMRLPVHLSSTVTAIAVAALAIGWLSGGHRPATGVVLNEMGIIAFYVVAMFARRLREANDQAQRLIVELEETRAAQAQAAALGERQRLAREMHDVLAHSLSGLVLNLEGARLLAQRDGGARPVTEAIERAHRLAKSGLEEARRAIGMLRDDELPGPQRLAELVAEFEGDTGVACRLDVSGDERDLGSDGRLTMYRVAQEALTNIRKHACPAQVRLHLAYEANGIRLTVEDVEANGGAPPAGGGTGYGLTGMRERAELLGGTLETGSTGTGFRVELWVPA